MHGLMTAINLELVDQKWCLDPCNQVLPYDKGIHPLRQ